MVQVFARTDHSEQLTETLDGRDTIVRPTTYTRQFVVGYTTDWRPSPFHKALVAAFVAVAVFVGYMALVVTDVEDTRPTVDLTPWGYHGRK